MRGIIKGCILAQEQSQRVRCEQLEAKILELGGHAGHPDVLAIQHQLALAWTELRQRSLEEAKQCWQTSIRRVYELGDKAGKLLYWLAIHGAVARVVPAIRDGEGNTHVELDAIAPVFSDYYQELYTKDPLPHLVKRDSMVWDLPVPTVHCTLAQDLDRPLTVEEVDDTISVLNGVEPPGLMATQLNTIKNSAHYWCLII
ncbi:hypothetical protein NDU88_004729 [Pleurodeles waltl]|uniref:Uncharacterized protein n=1 Tax=Pleurodeles waltl TaxID=8319 RepID=A0AAV7T8R7_PLEWA|nr:hypothetical protein NDU88_004729 [Pleurodeles waltl]